jgi:hypothetical protein
MVTMGWSLEFSNSWCGGASAIHQPSGQAPSAGSLAWAASAWPIKSQPGPWAPSDVRPHLASCHAHLHPTRNSRYVAFPEAISTSWMAKPSSMYCTRPRTADGPVLRLLPDHRRDMFTNRTLIIVPHNHGT